MAHATAEGESEAALPEWIEGDARRGVDAPALARAVVDAASVVADGEAAANVVPQPAIHADTRLDGDRGRPDDIETDLRLQRLRIETRGKQHGGREREQRSDHFARAFWSIQV